MIASRDAVIPSLVRMKPGALDRLGIYCQREGFQRVTLLHSDGLLQPLMERACAALRQADIEVAHCIPVRSIDFADVTTAFHELPAKTSAIIGLGGGKALDVAKYISFLGRRPYLAVPTSLSNDGFCSAQSSLALNGIRRSLPASVPQGLVLDTQVCLDAPRELWLSGVGDLVAKFTAVADWKLAFHAVGEPVDDFAALLSDASVWQFIARPNHDLEGMRLLGTALMLNGVAMAICGSSRPASGSEHLISHALDQCASRPRLHGLQVGVASFLISLLQGGNSDVIDRLFEKTGFWDHLAVDPFRRADWLEAARIAPTIKPDFHTVLTSRDCFMEIQAALDQHPQLARVIV